MQRTWPLALDISVAVCFPNLTNDWNADVANLADPSGINSICMQVAADHVIGWCCSTGVKRHQVKYDTGQPLSISE